MTVNKILTVLASGFIVLSLIVIYATGTASGYEISIYDAYPTYFWLFIVSSLICGIFILVNQSFAQKKSFWWIAGFLIVALTNLIVLLLPIFRGYACWSASDTLSQLGYVKDILFTGHFAPAGGKGENFYPAAHILASAICSSTGINAELLIMVLPAFFFLFYVLSIFVFSRHLTQNLGKAILITTFGSLLLFKYFSDTFAPNVLTFFLLPFVLFLYFKSRTSSLGLKFWVPLTLVLLAIPFYHPGEVPLFLLLIFLCIDQQFFIFS